MRVGVSLTSARRAEDPRRGAAFMVEGTKAAWNAGLESLFVGDHHAKPGADNQNVPLMGRHLAEGGDRPAGCLFLFPLWNPVLLAEQVGTLAAIARGRFIVQCGLGDGADQFGAMGVEIKTRPSAFEQAFDAVKRLLAGETVTMTGRFTFENARVALRPADPVEYWIGASADPAIDRAARLADGWLASPGLVPAEAKRQIDYYRARCATYGRTPSAIAIRRDVYVGESAADVETAAGPALRGGYRGFDPAALVAGTVEQVAEKFSELARMGYTDVIIRHLTDDQRQVLGSYERLAQVRRAVAGA
jgi:alkanesulfonate monooxygenase SsuD/methylene tetrahydromethanopterin reductase-like flavin-dependent oxidoreductase (luciferase family)